MTNKKELKYDILQQQKNLQNTNLRWNLRAPSSFRHHSSDLLKKDTQNRPYAVVKLEYYQVTRILFCAHKTKIARYSTDSSPQCRYIVHIHEHGALWNNEGLTLTSNSNSIQALWPLHLLVWIIYNSWTNWSQLVSLHWLPHGRFEDMFQMFHNMFLFLKKDRNSLWFVWHCVLYLFS